MKIVVFTKNWIGDVIFHSPALQAIKANFPDCHLIVVTSPRCVEILNANPFVDEIMTYDDRGKEGGFWARSKLTWKLRKMKIDKIFLFHKSFWRAYVSYCAGAKERIGYKTKKGRSILLTTPVAEKDEIVHDVQYFTDLLQAAGLKVENDYQYEFFFKPDDLRKAEELLRLSNLNSDRLIAINPGANWIPKRWPPMFFAQLAKKLIERYQAKIIISGNEDDAKIAAIIQSQAPNAISFCGKTSLRVLGALYSKCKLVVSSDTGPSHIASGVGATVVSLFGPTSPLETAPMGKGKNIIIHHAPEGIKLPWIGKIEDFPAPWMEFITVDDVLNVIEKERLIQ